MEQEGEGRRKEEGGGGKDEEGGPANIKALTALTIKNWWFKLLSCVTSSALLKREELKSFESIFFRSHLSKLPFFWYVDDQVFIKIYNRFGIATSLKESSHAEGQTA